MDKKLGYSPTTQSRASTITLTFWSGAPGASSRHDATHSTEVLKPQRRIHREILRRLSISSPQGRLIWGYLRPPSRNCMFDIR